ncbi:MAG: hypothetical protein GC171_15090 [Terrimonas sp.]|nr:hypothetical protein [Terrimonas sp.]
MAEKKKPGIKPEIPKHPVVPEIDPEQLPEYPETPEEDPDAIPDEDPFETPPYEIPPPGEGP